MTNKQTIDGVSREAIEAILGIKKEGFVAAWKELRALLDKEVDGNPHAPENKNESNVSGCCCPPKGYTGSWAAAMCPVHQGLRRLKPAAQSQGEVERLIAQCIEKDALIAEMDRIGSAQLAERDALLREIAGLDPRGEFLGWQLDGKIDSILSASAEPKPRGEQVTKAKPVAKLHAERLTGRDGEYGITVEDLTWFNTCRVTGGVFNLYAEQPSHSGDANEMVDNVVLPDDWEDKLMDEMSRRFSLYKMVDDDHMVVDDTQVGVEFARDWIKAKLNGIRP